MKTVQSVQAGAVTF
jgi:hypothetical protein